MIHSGVAQGERRRAGVGLLIAAPAWSLYVGAEFATFMEKWRIPPYILYLGGFTTSHTVIHVATSHNLAT